MSHYLAIMAEPYKQFKDQFRDMHDAYEDNTKHYQVDKVLELHVLCVKI